MRKIPKCEELEGLTIPEICERFRCGTWTAREWRKHYGLPNLHRNGSERRLTAEDVALMRALRPEVRIRDIADKFDVSVATASDAINGKRNYRGW